MMDTRTVYILLPLLASVFASSDASYPFMDPTLPWDQRVDNLVSLLTLEEIAEQTEAVYGNHTPAIPRLGIKPYVWITECLRGQANTDATAFPQAIGLAASFNPGLVFRIAEAVSMEIRAHWNVNSKDGKYETFNGLSCFSPVINIMRHPLWGRNQETYGEDPYLSGRIVTGYITGLQGDNPRYVRASGGCKHFDVHGGPENIPVSRFSFDAKVSTRDWRMTFLPAFKACIDAGTYSLMCSYNSINGIPACANSELLTKITRQELGFKGYIISDAGAISNMMSYHNYTTNAVDTVTAAMKAGTNIELGNNYVFMSQLDAMKQGKLTEQELRDNVKPLLYTRMRLGEFDPIEMNPYNQIDESVIQNQQHTDLATLAASQTFVLLKNDNKVLPLMKHYSKVAIVGPFSDNMEQQYGDYAPKVSPTFASTPASMLKNLGMTSASASGCDDTKCNSYTPSDIKTAISGADLVVVCVGTGQAVESEGNDRDTLALPGKQQTLLQDAVNFGSNATIILLLFNAGPLDISWALNEANVPVILECFFPAQTTGVALYNTLTMSSAEAVPAARLQATWPTELSQIPPIVDYTMTGRTYRYYKADPLFPFGYGMSYSEFIYEDLLLSDTSISPTDVLKVSVTVKNLGPYDADEVVQLYVSWPVDYSDIAPVRQLVQFQRVSLTVGVPLQIDFQLMPEQFQLWVDDDNGFRVLPGKMTLYAGGQQPNQKKTLTSNVLSKEFTITASKTPYFKPVVNQKHPNRL